MTAKFELGRTCQSRGIYEACANDEAFTKEIYTAFAKYIVCDWGNTCPSDCELNEEALKDGARIFAKYITSKGNVFIITEADRSATTILFADEY